MLKCTGGRSSKAQQIVWVEIRLRLEHFILWATHHGTVDTRTFHPCP